jgi:hypothetical protein
MLLYSALQPILGKAGTFLLSILILWMSLIVHFDAWVEEGLHQLSKFSKNLTHNFAGFVNFKNFKFPVKLSS